MTIAHRGLKVRVKTMGHANAVGLTSMEGSVSSYGATLTRLNDYSVICIDL